MRNARTPHTHREVASIGSLCAAAAMAAAADGINAINMRRTELHPKTQHNAVQQTISLSLRMHLAIMRHATCDIIKRSPQNPIKTKNRRTHIFSMQSMNASMHSRHSVLCVIKIRIHEMHHRHAYNSASVKLSVETSVRHVRCALSRSNIDWNGHRSRCANVKNHG